MLNLSGNLPNPTSESYNPSAKDECEEGVEFTWKVNDALLFCAHRAVLFVEIEPSL